MRLTPATVAAERDWVADRAPVVVPIINEVRADLGDLFDTDVESVSESAYREEVDAVFADGDLAVNVAGLVALLREVDVAGDYPGFVVDELLGRELAGMVAGGQPLRLLGQATFHYADVMTHGPEEAGGEVGDDAAADPTRESAGGDDLDAALAAGFQTRLPGWEWTASDSPFAVE